MFKVFAGTAGRLSDSLRARMLHPGIFVDWNEGQDAITWHLIFLGL
jgi:hypothetical protein